MKHRAPDQSEPATEPIGGCAAEPSTDPSLPPALPTRSRSDMDDGQPAALVRPFAPRPTPGPAPRSTRSELLRAAASASLLAGLAVGASAATTGRL